MAVARIAQPDIDEEHVAAIEGEQAEPNGRLVNLGVNVQFENRTFDFLSWAFVGELSVCGALSVARLR
jgi:hypothetical protein